MVEMLKNFVGGQWRSADTDAFSDNLNPADTSDVICRFPLSTRQEASAAVDIALAAQKDWKKVPAPARGTILFKAVRLMEERSEELAQAMTREEGKIIAESRGEVGKAIRYLEFAAGDARRFNGLTVPSEMPSTFACTVRVPLGVVGLITPWNFPVAIPTWKIAPALMAGNAVVLKPSAQTPLTAKIIVEIFEAAGIPPGVLNLVFGRGSQVGNELVEHPRVKGLSFTGSTSVGCALYSEGAKLGKKVQCEMGGKNPVIVLEDADLDLAAASTSKGAFGATGQRCTATSRAIVHRSVYGQYVERVVELAKAHRPGPGIDPTSTLGPSVDQGQLDQVLRYIELGTSQGATLAAGGHRLEGERYDRGFFVEPTVFTDVSPEMVIAREEIFGPVLSVVPVDSFEEALEVANNTEYGLSSALFTADVNRVFRYIEDIETGMIHVNSPTIGGEAQLPFGGIKDTGVGDREMGPGAMDFFSETKTVYIDYTGTQRTGNVY